MCAWELLPVMDRFNMQYVSEGFFSMLLCVRKVGMEIFYLHGLILCVFEDFLSLLLGSHIVHIDGFFCTILKIL